MDATAVLPMTPVIDPARGNALKRLFTVPKPLIGTVHVLPLPGAPRYRGQPLSEVVALAVEDAVAYVDGGFDAVIIENEGDIPWLKPDQIGPETVAGLAVVGAAVRAAVDVPLGVFCLANAVVESIAIAKACGGTFVRANQWANAYVANEGIVEGAAATALRYRSALRAEEVEVLADVHVKHGAHAIVADRSIEEQTWDVEAFDADCLIATGQRTGDPTRVEDIQAIKHVATLPVMVGSGLNAENAPAVMSVADGAIVASAAKHGGVWWNPVAVERVRAIVDAVTPLR